MKKIKALFVSFESSVIVIFAVVLVALIISSLASIATMRSTIASRHGDATSFIEALIEVEQIRNIAEIKTSDARGFFLLGSKNLFDEQKLLKQQYEEKLAKFEKDHPLPKIPEIIKRLRDLEQQHQDTFEQAMKYREKKTESKIVGQFFQSKANAIRKEMNAELDQIPPIAKAELEKTKEESLEIASRVESQVTRDMKRFMSVTIFLVVGLILVILRLLTQRSRHQAERDRLFEDAKKAHQSRDEVMSAISHDLKNPLVEITQNIESIQGAGVSNIGETIEAIKHSVVETEYMINDILDQAKSQEGRLTLRLDQLEINELLNEARHMLEPMAKKRDVRLQIDSANPPTLVFFDRERVLRVLSNLVGNAVKFSPKHGKVAIRVRGDQQFAYISVTDSGPGIPEKNQAQLFDQHWQSPKTAEQGAGVGLAIVKTIVEAHGGTVKVDSQPGNGSTFTFSLPKRRPASAVIVKKPTSSVKTAPRTT